MEIHLVADTNLFFECKPLDQLPWQELGYDPIVILLAKPVLDEIDKHKNANSRTRDRALEIFRRVRQMLKFSVLESEIRTSSPKVVLRRMPSVKPDPALEEHLDYTKTDERLIGIVSTLNARSPEHRVILFTEDAGPAMTADGLAIPYLMIDESWRRPPLATDDAKRIKELKREIEAYRAQEPRISIGTCESADGSNTIAATRKVATPLTQMEIGGFLAALKLKHALVTDFTPPSPSSTTDASGEVTKIEYSSPAEDDISKYRDVLYPQWIERCHAILSQLHHGRDEIEPPVMVRWPISNNGTRPASQVRLEFEAKGSLALRRIRTDDDEDSATGAPLRLPPTPPTTQFPLPPKPPSFQKQVTRISPPAEPKPKVTQGLDISKLMASGALGDNPRHIAEMSKMLGRLDTSAVSAAARLLQHDVFRTFSPDAFFGQASPETVSYRPLRTYIPDPHDPESFYYEDWPTTGIVKKGALTCDLWRHQASEQVFEFEVLFTKTGEARGIVECTVHAENLAKPEQARLIVSRTLDSFSVSDVASAMVEICN
ncbi:PIN domain-containing protein [Mesorhizobium sp. M0968]|uniref:PIN domain-containing protein n=1 Tax=Mesorhizobium sp. M0968 TaxID=2957037 RepID=UPI0033366133